MKKSNLLKLLFLALTLTFGCNNDDESFSEPVAQKEALLQHIRTEEDSELVSVLADGFSQYSNKGRIQNTVDFTLDIEEAIRLIDTANDVRRYTLRIADPEAGFENLIISKKQEAYYAYIMQYIPTYEWLTAQQPNFESFTGKVRLLDLNRKLFTEWFMQDGTSVTETTNGRVQTCITCTLVTETSNATGMELPGGLQSVTWDCGGITLSFMRVSGCGGGIPTSSMSDFYFGDNGNGWIDGGGGSNGSGASGGSGGSSSGGAGVFMPEETIDLLEYMSRPWREDLAQEQDPDLARQKLLNYLNNFGGEEGKEFVAMYNELWNTPGIDYADKLQLNQMAYDYKQQLVAQYFMGIFSPDNVGIIIGFAITPSISNTLRTRTFNVIPRYLSKSTVGKGYASFEIFKRAHGAAGEGKAWHHIVEQNKIGQFSAQQIHNTKNLVIVEAGAGSVHARITGYYGSIQRFTNGQTVRNWMKGQSFAEQMEFGLDILYRVKNGLPFP